VGRQGRINLVVENVVDPIFQGTVFINLGDPGIGRLDGELAPKLVLLEIDDGLGEEWLTALFELSGEPRKGHRDIVFLRFSGAAIGNAGFR